MLRFFQKGKEIGSRGEDLPVSNEGLPDSYRPNGICPRCGKQSSFENAGSLPVTFDSAVLTNYNSKQEHALIDRVSSLICRNCGHGVVVVEEEYIGDSPKKQQKSGGVVSFRGIYWWPLPENNLSADIPKEIAKVFSEAATALIANLS
jgi:ribosomal protein S27AE